MAGPSESKQTGIEKSGQDPRSDAAVLSATFASLMRVLTVAGRGAIEGNPVDWNTLRWDMWDFAKASAAPFCRHTDTTGMEWLKEAVKFGLMVIGLVLVRICVWALLSVALFFIVLIARCVDVVMDFIGERLSPVKALWDFVKSMVIGFRDLLSGVHRGHDAYQEMVRDL